MPVVPIVHVSRRVTVTKQGSTQRPYACASCGYRAQIEVCAEVRASADGSIVEPARHIEAEARERAEAGFADEMQDLVDLVPCPKCGARSENAGLYRQNTVLMVMGCLCLGAALGGYSYLMKPANRTGLDSPMAALLYSMALGVVLACWCWYRRDARIQRVGRAVRFLSADEAPSPRARRRGSS
jgi:hypothetical protein